MEEGEYLKKRRGGELNEKKGEAGRKSANEDNAGRGAVVMLKRRNLVEVEKKRLSAPCI